MIERNDAWAACWIAEPYDDARAVRVQLTADGEQILVRLSALHRDELRRMDSTLALPAWHDEPKASETDGS
jgi:hypothetical protein